jgi:hypothetical protein
MVSRWQPHCVVVSSASSSCAWLGASDCCKSSEWHFSGVVAQAALKPNRWRLKVRVSICFVLGFVSCIILVLFRSGIAPQVHSFLPGVSGGAVWLKIAKKILLLLLLFFFWL